MEKSENHVARDHSVQRQLLLTPEAKSFLESEYSQAVKELADQIVRALDGRMNKDGRTRLTCTGWLLFITDAPEQGAPERVVVWRGATDGICFKAEIVDRTLCAGTNFL